MFNRLKNITVTKVLLGTTVLLTQAMNAAANHLHNHTDSHNISSTGLESSSSTASFENDSSTFLNTVNGTTPNDSLTDPYERSWWYIASVSAMAGLLTIQAIRAAIISYDLLQAKFPNRLKLRDEACCKKFVKSQLFGSRTLPDDDYDSRKTLFGSNGTTPRV